MSHVQKNSDEIGRAIIKEMYKLFGFQQKH